MINSKKEPRGTVRYNHQAQRVGAVLLVVTVVLVLISLAVVGLISLMQTDLRATHLRGEEMILENLSNSGESLLVAWAGLSREERAGLGGLTDNPEFFRHQSLVSNSDGDAGSFGILPSIPVDADEPVRFGASNESSKLNLNTLMEWENRQPGSGEHALLGLPGMTPDSAAAIMDWLDGDSVSRPMGAEIEQYVADGRPARPANRVPKQLDELVQVKSTSRGDWFGDSSTALAKVRPSTRRAASTQHVSWDRFLTVHSRERNESATGDPRVYLNDNDLIRLHQRLTARLGKSLADFVLLYRQYGPAQGQLPRFTGDLDLDFSIPARFQFQSELDLVGAVVSFRPRNNQMMIINSPLVFRRGGSTGQLEHWMDQVTVDSRSVVEGRINIDEAPREVLLAIPGMDPTIADQILSFRHLPADGRLSHLHATWLVERGIVDLTRMKQLLPFVTTGGNVFQANIVAYFPFRPTLLRELVVVDGTDPTRGQVYCKDLRDVENVIDIAVLLPSGSPNEPNIQ